MTNQIELMMETAGVEARCQTEDGTGCKYCLKDYSCKLHRNRTECSYMLNGWDFNYYPDFTAEKQLEIIKLIIDKCHTFDIFKGFSKDAVFHIGAIEEWSEYKYNGENQDFTQALAQLTTKLMKAGELDKEKVKEILENAR